MRSLRPTRPIPVGTAAALVACGLLASVAVPALSQGVILPFSGSVSSPGPAFQVNNNGSGPAVVGQAAQSIGVVGQGGSMGVYGAGDDFGNTIGVYGQGTLYALEGYGGQYGCLASGNTFGVAGTSGSGFGVYAFSQTGTALRADRFGGVAGLFNGDVQVNGSINVTGTKNFMIDHPEDPKNKYLMHASIESSEMKNLYDGVVTLDAQGKGTVSVPHWFEALNKDFRYQLTAIGAPAPGLYVASELEKHQFQIAGGKPGMKVSWQVTGVRHDAYAEANPMNVEVEKPASARGTLLFSPSKKQANRPLVPFPSARKGLREVAQVRR